GEARLGVAAAAREDGVVERVGWGENRPAHDVDDAGRPTRAAWVAVFARPFENGHCRAELAGAARRDEAGQAAADADEVVTHRLLQAVNALHHAPISCRGPRGAID